jgi:hypothetical protein
MRASHGAYQPLIALLSQALSPLIGGLIAAPCQRSFLRRTFVEGVTQNSTSFASANSAILEKNNRFPPQKSPTFGSNGARKKNAMADSGVESIVLVAQKPFNPGTGPGSW